ncbi:VacJ family lipoprotein [Geomonas sp. RF6]|uniref:MlaA family lipoprotein n=1 Tax=Geomonas sp. RF6 TaxID=2897342 RepID=UPI001E4CD6EE|nr:VacJ family lipoprotein [Geomonas sp. RF6]UFS71132.1 VacJ family lipoprotein [Geomonas sp. RF6]
MYRPPLAKRVPLVLLISLFLAGCASQTTHLPPEEPPRHTISEFQDERLAYVPDPWEHFNRSMYRFNYYFDRFLFIPVVKGYETVTPVFFQNRVSSFFGNLKEVRNLTNSILQLKGKESLTTLGRFVTNSTIGIGGLFDPATSFGLLRRDEDFGLTLGHWGVDSGPYLVMPILGPSTARDTGGFAADSAMRFGLYSYLDPFGSTGSPTAIAAGVTTLEAVDQRHQVPFRYYRSGYPFEYYMVRFFYHQKRELDIRKAPASGKGPALVPGLF